MTHLKDKIENLPKDKLKEVESYVDQIIENYSIDVIVQIPIKELFNKTFVVPSYQRGYRWDWLQITQLLNDIRNFNKEKTEFYCLQPIIVKRYSSNENIEWEVIDGQQRLTTIYLILLYLKEKQNISITYDTRTSTSGFLDKVETINQNPKEYFEDNKQEDKIDNYYILRSFHKIKEWFTKHQINEEDFYERLVYKTQVIWYEIKENEGSDKSKEIFERINIGKIPLTNAELIKALFLNENNYLDSIKQDDIADKWDRYEFALQDKRFWAFLNQDVNNLPSRIELILDLISDKHGNKKSRHERLHTYFHFNEEINNIGYEKLWNKVELFFNTLLEWYETPDLYHYIGYLILTNFMTISDIVKKYYNHKNISKLAFIQEIKKEIGNKLSSYDDLETLDYNYNKNEIINILLLFNIKTHNDLHPYNPFPFERYKEYTPSLEHIHAQQSGFLEKDEEIKSFIVETLEQIKNLKSEVNREKLERYERDLKTYFENPQALKDSKLMNDIYGLFSDSKENEHSIKNLALIGKKLNSSLSNKVFPNKRKKIIELEAEIGEFIPICTKNVFLKYYSKDILQMYFWNQADKDAYFKKIDEVYSEFVENNNAYE